MRALQLYAASAGFLFGVWPYLLKKSGLQGNVASLFFTAVILAVIAPFAWVSGFDEIRKANWFMLVAAGIISAAGLLCFNSMLAGAEQQKANLGPLFLVMILCQISVPAVQQMVADHQFVPAKAAGIVLAIVSAVLIQS